MCTYVSPDQARPGDLVFFEKTYDTDGASHVGIYVGVQAAMPWVFIGGETICYLVIALTFIFMLVEKYGKLDHKAIVQDQKAAAEAEGRAYISAEEKIRLEEGEEAYQAELKKQADAAAAELKKLEKLSAEQRKALADKEAALIAEYNELRKANGRTPIEA